VILIFWLTINQQNAIHKMRLLCNWGFKPQYTPCSNALKRLLGMQQFMCTHTHTHTHTAWVAYCAALTKICGSMKFSYYFVAANRAEVSQRMQPSIYLIVPCLWAFGRYASLWAWHSKDMGERLVQFLIEFFHTFSFSFFWQQLVHDFCVPKLWKFPCENKLSR